MAVKYFGRLTAYQRPFDIFRRLEVGLRAIFPLPVTAYETYEPVEIIRIFEDVAGIEVGLSILDIDPTVLAVAWSELGARLRNVIFADLSVFPNASVLEHAGKFDVVFASAVLSRIDRADGRLNAARNLMSLCRPGGILSLSSPAMLEAGCLTSASLNGFCRIPSSAVAN